MASLSNDLSHFVIVNLEPENPGRGPFVVTQRGTDPSDPRLIDRGFALTKDGEWVEWAWTLGHEGESLGMIIFETIQEAIRVIESLEGKPKIKHMPGDPSQIRAALDQVEAQGGLQAAIRRILAHRPPKKAI